MTEKIKMEFPRIISVEIPSRAENPFKAIDQSIAGKVHNAAAKGVVRKDGTWTVDPGFKLEKLDIGKYKVTHNWGRKNTSINVTLVEFPGSIFVSDHNPMFFIVETLVDKVPTDKEFAFTLVMVV